MSEIFNEDGTPKGVYLVKASGRRPMSIQVSMGKGNLNKFYTLPGNDFLSAWSRAVNELAAYRGVERGSSEYHRLLASRAAFMQKYGLRTRKVEYLQAELMD